MRCYLVLILTAATLAAADAPQPRAALDSKPEAIAREAREIEGWKVFVSAALLAEDKAATERALELLQGQLKVIVRVVPQAAVAELRKVSLWISPEYAGIEPRAEYHPDAGWLRANRRDPAMAKGVEFTDVRNFEDECRRMPMLALHELAHAYHDRVLSHKHAGIKAAYERAKAGGKYDRVQRRNAKGKVRFDRAYALTNAQEYFAETSEAFFGVNDFFPYTREELEKHDPDAVALLEAVWNPAPKSPEGAK